ncbi:hypothetical protein DQ04_07381020 [Trypanosoma grayi]|uniref:hypothetical protein n=1 Tax=Trypanosoma grayi TaxID=71804 RepID=UPI0004F48A8E|nr:hypothetical protein DQ04_07381020 [Trypanosoma grayi]KEG08357.1 hypothetical protein DQ04_07381020 [Trypanosoma grayi]
MAKDRINFRRSMKYAHDAAVMEDIVGITALRTANTRYGDVEDARNSRVTGLMKWSLDDLVVQEVWPDAAITRNDKEEGDGTTSVAFVVSAIAEGVPDGVIAALIRDKCPHGTPVCFVTPVDFGSCHERFVLVRSASREARRQFQRPQTMHTAEGVVCIGKAIDIPLLSNASSPLPVHLLPDVRYSIVLRSMRGALADVLPRLEKLQFNGFLNYSHLARHGVGIFRAFESGRHLLHRDYVEFLQSYVLGLTECSPLIRKELNPLLDIFADPKSTRVGWAGVKSGLEYALKKDEPLIRRAQTGLFYPHHHLLRDLLGRASDLAPKCHDSAQIIRESIPRLVLQEKLRSVGDVHFNALASLRWEMYGDQVVAGDLVIPDDEAREPLDVFEAPADHINGEMTCIHHLEWLSVAGDAHLNALLGRVRVVQSAEEAKRYRIDQVVLPVMGYGAERLHSPGNQIKEASERLGRELQVEGLPQMKAAPPATYRRLVVCPKDFAYCVFDNERGWCWESNQNTPIRSQLYEDQEGITRQPSPLFVATGKNMIARRGIRGAEQRSHFLKPARRGGMTCVLRMTLPRGSAVTSALREVFQFATLDPGAIFHLLR